MATGDDSIAAGFGFVPDTGPDGKVRLGATKINETRDFLAQVKALIPSSKAAYRAAAGITVVTSLPGSGTDGDIVLKIVS